MSFGLGAMLPKEALHQLQYGIWALSATYTVTMISHGVFRRVSGSKSAPRWPIQYCLLNAAATAAVLAMLSIDGSFDYELLISGNSDAAQKQSWIYYRTMLTNPIVNLSAFTCFLVICVMPAIMRYDVQCIEYLRGMIGTFFYIVVIGRAYMEILQAEQLDDGIFVNWDRIVVSRWIMAVCGLLNLASYLSHTAEAEARLKRGPAAEMLAKRCD
eukprot:Tamp_29891.p1 GENE.Tamp_29891~~Tamp_29891.p1  ORF type:complete len:214 (+),score=37.85 Tamp_29891:87-728(+)